MPIKIMLDPGHGAGKAFNRGALDGNEGDNNFLYSLVLKRELEKRGFVVGTTRKKIGDNPSLYDRGRSAAGYDLFISLHSNAGPSGVRGTEIWQDIHNPFLGAQGLCAALAKAFGHRDRGIKRKVNSAGQNWYGVLRANRAKCGMLIEHGFHTNREDSAFYASDRGRKKLAEVTADYLAHYYGLKTEGKKTMGRKIITYTLDGDLANAVALFNVLRPTAYLTKGQPANVEKDDTVIQVGGVKESWADVHLAGDDRQGTLKACMDFALRK